MRFLTAFEMTKDFFPVNRGSEKYYVSFLTAFGTGCEFSTTFGFTNW